jgi:hypothetical protein
MDYEITLNESIAARRRIAFFLPDVADGYTPKTGQAGILAARVSKNGAATAAGAGAFTEIDAVNMPGMYYYECAVAEVDTVGFLLLVASAANCVTQRVQVRVGSSNYSTLQSISATIVSDVSTAIFGANINTYKGIANSLAYVLNLLKQRAIGLVVRRNDRVEIYDTDGTTLLASIPVDVDQYGPPA